MCKKRGTHFHLASFEPETPVGFSPCGVAFGALRKAYTAKCNFFADDSSLSNRIQWYFVPDGTPVYDKPHVFFPRVDQDQKMGPSPFEQAGPGKFTRRFNDGFDEFGMSKIHVDGDEQDFLGQSDSHKYWVDGHPPEPPCVGLQTVRVKWKLAGKVKNVTLTLERVTIPLQLAGFVPTFTFETVAVPLALTVNPLQFPGAIQTVTAPMLLQCQTARSEALVERFPAAMHLAGFIPGQPETIACPLQLAGLDVRSEVLYQFVPAAMQLAGLDVRSEVLYQFVPAALQLAGLDVRSEVLYQFVPAALQLAAISSSPASGIQTLTMPMQLAALSSSPASFIQIVTMPMHLAGNLSTSTVTVETCRGPLELAALSSTPSSTLQTVVCGLKLTTTTTDYEDENMIGSILGYAGTVVPTNYLACDGSAVSRTTYATLFGVLGTTWGSGDGSSTFNLPDFRDRVQIGNSPGTLDSARPTAQSVGGSGGEEKTTLAIADIPAHNHTLTDPGHTHSVGSGASFVTNATGATYVGTSATRGSTAANTNSNTTGITMANKGGGGAHNTMQPYAVVNFIIRAL